MVTFFFVFHGLNNAFVVTLVARSFGEQNIQTDDRRSIPGEVINHLTVIGSFPFLPPAQRRISQTGFINRDDDNPVTALIVGGVEIVIELELPFTKYSGQKKQQPESARDRRGKQKFNFLKKFIR